MHVFNSRDAMRPVSEQMALPGSRAHPESVAARFLARRALIATRASGRAFENCINERAANGFVRYLIGRQLELQEAQRAFDVHADRAGIDVRRRCENATDRRTVAHVRVRIEHEIGHAGAPRALSAC